MTVQEESDLINIFEKAGIAKEDARTVVAALPHLIGAIGLGHLGKTFRFAYQDKKYQLRILDNGILR